GDRDVGAQLGEPARRGPADAARAAGDERDAPRELVRRRQLCELVALERPVLDLERLRLAQRREAAERVRGGLDPDPPVVEGAGDARPASVRATRDETDARDEDDAWAGRIHRERARLVVDVALVVLAVPGRVLLHTAPERLRKLEGAVARRVEVDDERLVLRVDQVV